MKTLFWIGSSLDDLGEFPEGPRSEVGHAVYLSQLGDSAINAIPMTGFGNNLVLEVVMPEDSDAHRAVYIVKFDTAVCVLHAVQKGWMPGESGRAHDIKLVRSRLKYAMRRHLARFNEEKSERENEQGKR